MYPPIYSTCTDDAQVTALIGSRIYDYGEASQSVTKPYAVWQVISGTPENYLDKVPDMDSWVIQVDVYGDTAESVRNAAEALRDAMEPAAHVVSWRGESRDPETRNYQFSFDVEWMESRELQS